MGLFLGKLKKIPNEKLHQTSSVQKRVKIIVGFEFFQDRINGKNLNYFQEITWKLFGAVVIVFGFKVEFLNFFEVDYVVFQEILELVFLYFLLATVGTRINRFV